MAAHSVSSEPLERRGIHLSPGPLLLSLPALLVVLLLFVYPFIFGFLVSVHGADGVSWTLDNYLQFFRDSYQSGTIGITFQVALPVTFFSVAISVPLAYFMRHGIKFERLITILLILPLTLGTVMVAQAMLGYFGPIGWFNRILLGAGIIRQPLSLLHNWLGVEIALFIQGFPFVFLLIVGYMSALSPDLERASRMLGASSWQTFWRVVLPLSLPGIAVAFCLNFVSNFGVFPTAELVGDPSAVTHVISIAAYDAYANSNSPLATAIALLMGVIELFVVMLVLWLRNRFTRAATISGGKGA